MCGPDLKTPLREPYACGAPPNPGEPAGYLSWFDWARRMNKTHVQNRCTSCGLWHVWVSRGAT